MSAQAQFLPITLGGWVAVVAGFVTIVVAVFGVVIRLARAHINRRIEIALASVVQENVQQAMVEAMGPIQLQLTTMNGEIARVRRLEQKIENGLSDRTERIEADVKSIKDHLLWDGTERRRNGGA